jgi:hypothetical protein
MSDPKRETNGGNPTAPTSGMWKSSFPKGKDPRQGGGK